MITAKTIRAIVGFIVIMAIILRGNAIMNFIDIHPSVGVLLLLCAMTYVAWGMFWKNSKV